LKKNNPIQLSIPEPCSQDWNAMTSDAKGHFCAHCQKSVIDFTEWTDADLYAFFSKNNQSVCGRFKADQLDRAIQFPVQQPTRLYRVAIALGLSLLFTQLPTTHARPKPPLTDQYILSTQEVPQNDTTGTDSLVIKGTVLDATKQPAINAIVSVEQCGVNIGGTVTDIDGNFEIVLPDSIKGVNIQLKTAYAGHMTAIFPYDATKQTIIIPLKATESLGMIDRVIIYKRPIIDPAHPGPNTTFTHEQIKNIPR